MYYILESTLSSVAGRSVASDGSIAIFYNEQEQLSTLVLRYQQQRAAQARFQGNL